MWFSDLYRFTKICIILFSACYFLISCTDHINPFDPENEDTRGKPFNLRVIPSYGEIILEWNPLKYDDENKKLMKIDSFQIYRKINNGEWNLKSTTDTCYFDIEKINSQNLYTYKISAKRQNQESDCSEELFARAFWYPDSAITTHNTNPYNITGYSQIVFCEKCQVYYVNSQKLITDYLLVFDSQTDQQIDNIEMGNDLRINSLALWHNTSNDSDLLYCLSSAKKKLIIIDIQKKEIKSISTYKYKPYSIQVLPSLNSGFIAFTSDISYIKSFELNTSIFKDSIEVAYKIDKLFGIDEKQHLIGICKVDRCLTFINLNSKIVNYSESLEPNPVDIAYSPVNDLIYVACEYEYAHNDSSKICVINRVTGKRIPEKEISIPNRTLYSNPRSLTIFHDKLYNKITLFVAVQETGANTDSTGIYAFDITNGKLIAITTHRIIPKKYCKPYLIRFHSFIDKNKLYLLESSGIKQYLDF